MKSIFYFVVSPLDGKRYNNVMKIGDVEFIISSSMEDHTVTNRFAEIKALPIGYEGPIQIGDIVVVHHNVFRIYYDMKGRDKSSWSFINNETYIIDDTQLYLYKHKDEWKSVNPYVFVEPILQEEKMFMDVTYEESFKGYLRYVPENDLGLYEGQKIVFEPESEYEFKIGDKRLYRMKLNNICLTI